MKPQVTVNGKTHELGDVGGHVTLLEWLRSTGFTGSKEGLRGGRVRRLRGDGVPPGRQRVQPVDRDQRLPGARGRAGQPGGHHRRRAR